MQHQEPSHQQRNSADNGSAVVIPPAPRNFSEDMRGKKVVGHPVGSKDDNNTGAMDKDSQLPSAEYQQESDKKARKPKTHRPPKVHAQRLLSSLFRTTISSEAIAASRKAVSTTTTGTTTRYQGPPTSKGRRSSDFKAHKKVKGSKPFASPTGSHASITSNEVEAADEKIENWYITYKAHLEPKTRRLMVLTKPTTVRQQNQLKTMRKHHWECKTEIEQQLKRQVPTAFSLRIVRSRIDWERVAPYITLMIQAVSLPRPSYVVLFFL